MLHFIFTFIIVHYLSIYLPNFNFARKYRNSIIGQQLRTVNKTGRLKFAKDQDNVKMMHLKYKWT